MTRVPKTLMPKRGSPGRKEGGCRKLQRIERSGAVTSDDLVPSGKILHRATKGVKFHRAVRVDRELTNGKKILNKVRRHQHFIKMEGMWKDSTDGGDPGKEIPIHNDDR